MVKVTTTDFIARAKAVHGDKYDYSVTEYVKSSTKLTIICPVHGEFKVLPSNHVGRRSGCPKCAGQEKLTSESFRERAGEIHGDHYDYSEVQYVNRKTKVTIVCPTHGEFQQTPKAHLTGNGCNKCGWDKLRRKKAMGREEFVSRSREIHSSRYDYHLVEYTNNRTPVTIICPVHGPFEQRPEVHLLGNGSIQCGYESLARWRTKSREQFIADAIAKHGDYYDYSKVDYKHGEQDVTIICPIHGEFQQRPQNHTWGFGCGKCAGNQQLTTEEFIKRLVNCMGTNTTTQRLHIPEHITLSQ